MITPAFLVTVVILSLSGVLTPGPLFLASILRAAKSGTVAGIECAVGHTIVEFPLVMGLAVGLSTFFSQGLIKTIAITGGVVLAGLAILQLNQARSKIELNTLNISKRLSRRPTILVGIALTGLNPFFLLWWLTVGTYLISQAYVAGTIIDVLAMFAAHIWMDYAWLGGTAGLASRGHLLLGKWYRGVLVVFGVVMIYFATSFIISGLS